DPRALDELRGAGLVRGTGRQADGAVEPYHDRIRERVALALDADEARGLHLALAEFFENEGRAEADAIAHHYAAAGDAERAVRWMRAAAADATASLAFARAADLYGRAAALTNDDDEGIDLLV